MTENNSSSDDLVFAAETPIFQTDSWRLLYETDLEIRQTAYLLGAIAHYYNLDPIDLDRPIIQRFVTPDGSYFYGSQLQPFDNGRYEMSAVLAMHREAPIRKIDRYQVRDRIRNLPVVGVTKQPDSSQEVEQYDLCSLYRLRVFYGVQHSKVLDAVMELFGNITCQLTYGDNLFRASELGLCSQFLRNRNLARGPWKSKF